MSSIVINLVIIIYGKKAIIDPQKNVYKMI
jgi:hypothetical protein